MRVNGQQQLACSAVCKDRHNLQWQLAECLSQLLCFSSGSSASAVQAFAVAVHACHAHCSGSSLHEPVSPLLPRYVADQPAALPASSSVPLPTVEVRYRTLAHQLQGLLLQCKMLSLCVVH